MPSIYNVNVLRGWGYLRQLKTKILNQQSVRVFQHIGVGIMGKASRHVIIWTNRVAELLLRFQGGRIACMSCEKKKSELRKWKPSKLDLPNRTKLYINESLCPYYRGLWNQCKKLWNKQGIFSFFIVNGSTRTKIRKNGPYKITHIADFKDIFPDEDFTMS